MSRRLGVLNLLLLVMAGGLWIGATVLDGRARARREHYGTLRPLVADPVTLEELSSLELSVFTATPPVRYRRSPLGWRLPDHRDAFARQGDLQGLVNTVLGSQGTIVGELPAGAERYGVTDAESFRLEGFDASGALRVHVRVGRVAPGQRSRETYCVVEGRPWIFHADSNPWPHLRWQRGAADPPLLDRRVIPEALGRRSVTAVTFSGERATGLEQIISERVEDADKVMDPRDGPQIEWYGIETSGERRRLGDRSTLQYLGELRSLTYDVLWSPGDVNAWAPKDARLVITLHYSEDERDVLELHPGDEEGTATLRLMATEQVFTISDLKARSLYPDAVSLLDEGR